MLGRGQIPASASRDAHNQPVVRFVRALKVIFGSVILIDIKYLMQLDLSGL